MANLATKWGWGLEMLGTKRRFFGNVVGHVKNISDATSLSAWTSEQFDPSLDWNKVKKIKEEWGGKVILKGILDSEDAKMALNVGADAIIVSNHGGRSLDAGQSTIKAMPRLTQEFGDKIKVMIDSGLREGPDIACVLASGADFAFMGRSFMYGVGALGKRGGLHTITMIKRQLQQIMEQVACPTVKELPKHLIKDA